MATMGKTKKMAKIQRGPQMRHLSLVIGGLEARVRGCVLLTPPRPPLSFCSAISAASQLLLQEQGIGHEQSAAMGMLPMMGQEVGPHHDQHLLAMASGGGGDLRAPAMLDEDWYFEANANVGGDAAAHRSMAMVPAAMGASGSASAFGAGSQMFPLLNLGGTGPFDVSGFNFGSSGNVGGDFTAFIGAGNAPNTAPNSLLPHGNTGSVVLFAISNSCNSDAVVCVDCGSTHDLKGACSKPRG